MVIGYLPVFCPLFVVFCLFIILRVLQLIVVCRAVRREGRGLSSTQDVGRGVDDSSWLHSRDYPSVVGSDIRRLW